VKLMPVKLLGIVMLTEYKQITLCSLWCLFIIYIVAYNISAT
jgi:hypothetical protein